MAEWIEWKKGDYGTEYGSVNGVRLFTISWSFVRGEGDILRTALPGFKNGGGWTGPSRDELKDHAAYVLAKFIGRVSKGLPETLQHLVGER